MTNYHENNSGQLKNTKVETFIDRGTCKATEKCGIVNNKKTCGHRGLACEVNSVSSQKQEGLKKPRQSAKNKNNVQKNKELPALKEKYQAKFQFNLFPLSLWQPGNFSTPDRRVMIGLYRGASHRTISLTDAYNECKDPLSPREVTRHFKEKIIKFAAQGKIRYCDHSKIITLKKPGASYRVARSESRGLSLKLLDAYIIHKKNSNLINYSMRRVESMTGMSRKLLNEAWEKSSVKYKVATPYRKVLFRKGKTIYVDSVLKRYLAPLKVCREWEKDEFVEDKKRLITADSAPVDMSVYNLAEKIAIIINPLFKKNIFIVNTPDGDVLIKNNKETGELIILDTIRRTKEQMLCSEYSGEVIEGLTKSLNCDEDALFLAFERLTKDRHHQKQPYFTTPQGMINYYKNPLKKYLYPEKQKTKDTIDGDKPISVEKPVSVDKPSISLAYILANEDLIKAIQLNVLNKYGRDFGYNFTVVWLKQYAKSNKTVDLETGLDELVKTLSEYKIAAEDTHGWDINAELYFKEETMKVDRYVKKEVPMEHRPIERNIETYNRSVAVAMLNKR